MERCNTCEYVEGIFDSHLGSVSLKDFYLFSISFCKLLPENPTNHEDSRNSKKIQGVGITSDFLEIS